MLQVPPASPSGRAGWPAAGPHGAAAADVEELLQRLKQAEEEAHEQGQLRLLAQLTLVGCCACACGCSWVLLGTPHNCAGAVPVHHGL